MEHGFRVSGLLMALVLATAASASSAPLLTTPIDESHLVTLPGNTRPEVSRARDLGALKPGFVLDHLQLALRRSPANEERVTRFVESLQDPASANYHQWLSAEDFGARFGTDSADLKAVTAWLEAHGFTVENVPAGRMSIDFTGTAGAVAAAFHTEIHEIEIDGTTHIANMSDPRIPEALAPVVAGIAKLHDFRPRRQFHPRPALTGPTGCASDSSCSYLITPGDLQKIYGMNTVYAGKITGEGEIVAVAEDTNLYTNNDFSNFRSTFKLSQAYPTGSLTVTHPAPQSGTNNCINPGVNSNGDDVEATVDVEWASAAAPGAQIELASCDNSSTTDGVFLAIQNLVNAVTPPPIISVSYGYCEAENGASYNAMFNTVYQQAAGEGISIYVSTGDSGASDCAYSGNDTKYGIGINAWAATPYNVAVGGTDFSDTYSGTNTKYWSSTNAANWSSVKSYVPEMTWNDTCASTVLASYTTGSAITYGSSGFCNTSAGKPYLPLGGGEGGPSACFSGDPAVFGVVGGTCKGVPKPSWQKGVYGNPADGVRDVPDVSLFAADGVWSHYYLICFSDPGNSGASCGTNPYNWAGGGGTSYAAPILAGVQALLNQKMKGAKQGNPNAGFYKLANAEYGTKGSASCNSSLGSSVSTACVFYDVTLGNDSQPCKPPYDCYRPSGTYGVLSTSSTSYAVAYPAHAGWDFATGIGTVNVANLVAKWASVAP